MSEEGDEASDEELFRRAMDGVEPIGENNRARPWRPRLRPVPLDHLEEEEEDFDRLSSSEIETGDFLSFCRPGLQKRVFQELERGKIRFEWEVDLHGLTVDFARAELGRFLRHCAGQRVRCALIIHGKGLRSEERQPVLKQMTNLWLRQREEVLAFCSAVRRDGGTGATYVLLRRSEGKGRRRRG